MLEIIETMGFVSVIIGIALAVVTIGVICAIFEIKRNTADTAERLDEICKKLDDMPKNYSVLAVRNELVDIAENIKKE